MNFMVAVGLFAKSCFRRPLRLGRRSDDLISLVEGFARKEIVFKVLIWELTHQFLQAARVICILASLVMYERGVILENTGSGRLLKNLTASM